MTSHKVNDRPYKFDFLDLGAGAAVLNEKTLPAAVLVNAVFFVGLFVFAVMLGGWLPHLPFCIAHPSYLQSWLPLHMLCKL